MTLNADTIWMLVIGILAAVACAIPGSLLVMRRLSLLGDAISHAVLPGLVAGFLLSGSRSGEMMFLGAVIAGVFTAFLTETLRRSARVDEDASLGIVFTSLFAIGLILIVNFADRVDLDPSCVLYGMLETAPLRTITILDIDIPRAALWLSICLAVNSIVITLLFKELRITSFDPQLADVQGYSSRAMHYLLTTMTSVTTVAAFESVGSILVVAMLVVPAAAAQLLSDRLGPLVFIAAILAATSAILGQWFAIDVMKLFGQPSVNIAGSTAAATGLIFLVAWIASPRHGLVTRFWYRLRLAVRIAREDALGELIRAEESHAPAFTRQALLARVDASALVRTVAIRSLIASNEIQVQRATDSSSSRASDRVILLDKGRRRAIELLRSHRLWETYLTDRAQLAADHTHESAHRLEHIPIDPRTLASEAGHPLRDPQDKLIP
jgi:manganese/zinc/iron transport system permease protein